MIDSSLKKRVLVVAAHPDDEVLGCGGTIALYAEAGASVKVIYLSDGGSSRSNDSSSNCVEERYQQGISACQQLGVDDVGTLGLRDNQLDSYPLLDIVQGLEKRALGYQPNIIYTHFGSDLNIDHCIANRAVLTAFRPTPESVIEAIYSFEVPSSTHWQSISEKAFIPNRYVDISTVLEKKSRALRAYDSEMRSFPHARSYQAVDALAKFRGATVGVSDAEAFVVERVVERAVVRRLE